jgi:hypothetical protein
MSESRGPGGPFPEDLEVTVSSLVVSGHQLSWPLFAQLPDGQPVDHAHKRLLGRLLGTVSCPPPATHLELGRAWGGGCPFSAHRHILWRREGDGQLCCWTVTETRLAALAPRARALWEKHGQDLADLVGLARAGEARVEWLSGGRVRLDGSAIVLSPQSSRLLRELDFLCRTHDEDLARLRQHCLDAGPGEHGGDGEIGNDVSWRTLAALCAAAVLLDRLALRGGQLVHPRLWPAAPDGAVGRAWLLWPDGSLEAVAGDVEEQDCAPPAQRGLLYLAEPGVDPAEILPQVAAHFQALRVLLAQEATLRQLARIAQEGREKAELLARGRSVGAELLAGYADPLASAALPQAADLQACYRRERERHQAWIAQLEGLAVSVRALPRFSVETPAGQAGAGAQAAEGRREAGGQRDRPPRAATAQAPRAPSGGATAPPPPAVTLAERAREAVTRAGILHQYEPYPVDRLGVIVVDPLLLVLLAGGGAFAPLYLACLGGRPSAGLLALLGVLLLFLYGGLALFDGASGWQGVVRLRLRPRESGRGAWPVGIHLGFVQGRLPLAWEGRWHIWGFTYTSAFLLIWSYALLSGYITFEQSMGLTLLLVFIPLWLLHILRGGYLLLDLLDRRLQMRRARRRARR